jgi:hypothetical protein
MTTVGSAAGTIPGHPFIAETAGPFIEGPIRSLMARVDPGAFQPD